MPTNRNCTVEYAVRAEAEAWFAWRAAQLCRLELELNECLRILRELGINRGDTVLVDFEEGEEACVFDSAGECYLGTKVEVWLRHFTKQGKPRKTQTRYDWGIVECMKPLAKEDPDAS